MVGIILIPLVIPTSGYFGGQNRSDCQNSLNLVEFNFSKMKITPLGILSSILEGLPNEVVDRNKDTIDWEFV